MKKLKVAKTNTLVEVYQAQVCWFCKEKNTEVIAPVGNQIYGICKDCASQIESLIEDHGVIPDQV